MRLYQIQLHKMDEHFTNNAQAAYLGSLTQQKKILFLQRQLNNCEIYSKNLQQDLEATKLTLNRLIKQRTNNEVLVKMNENLYRMQRRCRQMQEMLKQNNAKLLIEMQLRIQQKLQYSEKVRQLQEQIDFIRKTNKDKQQEFTIIVNKLRKYEDIRQLMIQNKINNQVKKQLIIHEDDKSNIIRDIGEQLARYKAIHKQYHKDLDKKIQVLGYSLENNINYNDFKQQFNYLISQQTKANQLQKVVHEKVLKYSQTPQQYKIKYLMPNSYRGEKINLNDSTRQLVKQIKKLVISNKILEAALNDSIQKNKQLLINQKILAQANTQLKNQLQQYRKKQIRIRKKSMLRGNSSREMMGEQQLQKVKGLKRSQTFQYHLKQPGINQYQDDFTINLKKEERQLPELLKQKRLKQYLQTLKSKDYEVNIQNLEKDVHRMGQFLILCLGSRSKQAPYLKYNNMNSFANRHQSQQDKQLKNNERNSYMRIMQRNQKTNRLKNSRSLSFDQKSMENKQDKDKQITNLPIQSNFIRKGKNVNKNKGLKAGSSRTQIERYCNPNLRRYEQQKQMKTQNDKLRSNEYNPSGLSFGLNCNKLQISIDRLQQLQNQKEYKDMKIQQF